MQFAQVLRKPPRCSLNFLRNALMSIARSFLVCGLFVVVAVVALPTRVSASAIIDFEGLGPLATLQNQYSSSGVTFDHAAIRTQGTTLNEAQFPPHSGKNVAIDFGGAMNVYFQSPVSLFRGYFTYNS